MYDGMKLYDSNNYTIEISSDGHSHCCLILEKPSNRVIFRSNNPEITTEEFDEAYSTLKRDEVEFRLKYS